MDYTEKREFIKRALDTSNVFHSGSTEGGKVNPKIWDRRLREFQRKILLIAPQAEQFDFRSPGQDYTVTIDEEPDAALDATELSNLDVVPFSTRQVTFDPSEKGVAYQLTRAQAVRAFFNVAERMVTKLGYALGRKKDAEAYSEAVANGGHTIIAGGRASTADLTSSDVLEYDLIIEAAKKIGKAQYLPVDLFISFQQKEDLLKDDKVHKADAFGSRSAVAEGLIGSLFGVNIYVCHSIVDEEQTLGDTDDIYYNNALMLGTTMTGERSLGYAIKRDALIEREYHALGRYWDIVAHEEYDFKVLHPQGIVKIQTYAGVQSA